MSSTSRTAPLASRPAQVNVDRASSADRAFLAMDRGLVPQQFGVVLGLEQHLDLSAVTELVAERVRAVPRLRQRLVRVPFGLGGPLWLDDAGFDVRRHVRGVSCPLPGDEPALMSLALAAVTTRLPPDAPLWSVVLVGDVAGGRSALVVVLHHVLADGIGGLGVLAALVDPGRESFPAEFPRPRPPVTTLLADSVATKLTALVGLPASWRLLRSSMTAGGGLRPPPAAACSLVQRVGPRRQVLVVRWDVDSLRAAAHAHGATVNDALLVAVAGALEQVLRHRGEHADRLNIAVPVSGRPADADPSLGNLVSPLLVAVPTTGPRGRRLAEVAAAVRARKPLALAPAPIAVLGWLFRPLAALGGYAWYLNHQRRFHTLVSHVRGPAEPLSFGGSRIDSAVPLGVADGGNTTVYVDALSYDGTLTLVAVVDPDHFPDAGALTRALEDELRAVCSQS
jgi:diacylglycerol O-acyltransferase / wax synthase